MNTVQCEQVTLADYIVHIKNKSPFVSLKFCL